MYIKKFEDFESTDKNPEIVNPDSKFSKLKLLIKKFRNVFKLYKLYKQNILFIL